MAVLVNSTEAKEFVPHEHPSHTSPFYKSALRIVPGGPFNPTVFNEVKFDKLVRTLPLFHDVVVAELAKHEEKTTVVDYRGRVENARQNFFVFYPIGLLVLIILPIAVKSWNFKDGQICHRLRKYTPEKEKFVWIWQMNHCGRFSRLWSPIFKLYWTALEGYLRKWLNDLLLTIFVDAFR